MKRGAPLLFLMLCPAACGLLPPAAREPLVDLREADGRIRVDIRYATADNFTRTVLYPAGRCLLRASVAKRLSLVQSELASRGLGLKVWDCYRPLSVQKRLWALVPDPRYVADPKKGSRHNRGAAVDATLVDSAGLELEMPSAYDDFSAKARRDSTDASAAALGNRATLEKAMAHQGFEGLATEWWHFDAKGWERYPVMDAPIGR